MSKHILRAGKAGLAGLLALVFFSVVIYSAKQLIYANEDFADSYIILSEEVTQSDPNLFGDDLSMAYYSLNRGNRDDARMLFSHVLCGNPGRAASLMAYKELVVMDGSVSDPNYTPLTVDDLKRNFAGNPDLPVAVYDIACQYHRQALKMNPESQKVSSDALLEQSVRLLEESILNTTESQRLDTYIMLAESYSRLGDYQSALLYYDRLLEEYPAYEQDWHVYFMMGRCLEKLAGSGAVTYTQACEQITDLYLYIVQHYPECKAAKAANNWLAVNAQ
jgi:tetratricopeptide (TPR) repeat protein